MLRCWDAVVENRPIFPDVVTCIEQRLREITAEEGYLEACDCAQ